MSHTVRANDLQVGMKVREPILGKKGDIKVNKGEILSGGHVDKIKKWKGIDAANPNGIQVESTPKGDSVGAVPSIVDEPWRSPLVEQKSKNNLQRSVAVSVEFDKDGNIIRDEEEQKAEEVIETPGPEEVFEAIKVEEVVEAEEPVEEPKIEEPKKNEHTKSKYTRFKKLFKKN